MKADLFSDDMNTLYEIIRDSKKRVPYKNGNKLNKSEYARVKKEIKEQLKKIDKRSYWKVGKR